MKSVHPFLSICSSASYTNTARLFWRSTAMRDFAEYSSVEASGKDVGKQSSKASFCDALRSHTKRKGLVLSSSDRTHQTTTQKVLLRGIIHCLWTLCTANTAVLLVPKIENQAIVLIGKYDAPKKFCTIP